MADETSILAALNRLADAFNAHDIDVVVLYQQDGDFLELFRFRCHRVFSS